MIGGSLLRSGASEHSTVTLETHTASEVEKDRGRIKDGVTGERLALVRGIVEGLLMNTSNFAFVMWIA
jgi:hypothetical protein